VLNERQQPVFGSTAPKIARFALPPAIYEKQAIYRSSPGSLAKFVAMRSASSRVSTSA
jgi:hypothetical protein